MCTVILIEQNAIPRLKNPERGTTKKGGAVFNRMVCTYSARHHHYQNSCLINHLVKKCTYTLQISRYLTNDISTVADKDTSGMEAADSDFKSLVHKMVEKALERDRMVAVVPESLLFEHIKTLLNCGFTEANIMNISKYPALIKNLEEVIDVIHVLLDYGLQKKDITHILNIYPDIIAIKKQHMVPKIQMLQEQGLGIDAIVRMICKQPDLLDKDLSRVPQHIKELKHLFKTKDTFTLLEKSPVLLHCDMDYITERFNYVFVEMGISQAQMRYCNLFSHSMEHIHTRHMFLVRAGFFKKAKMKEGQKDLNPKLDMILDTSDAQFLKMFGNMTLKDYETFKRLLVRDRIKLKAEETFEDE